MLIHFTIFTNNTFQKYTTNYENLIFLEFPSNN